MDGRPSVAKYCGPACAQSAERERNQAIATQRRLEAEARAQTVQAARLQQRVCACGQVFVVAMPSRQIYCTPVCAREAAYERTKARRAGRPAPPAGRVARCSEKRAKAIVRLLLEASVLDIAREREAERRQLAAEGLL